MATPVLLNPFKAGDSDGTGGTGGTGASSSWAKGNGWPA